MSAAGIGLVDNFVNSNGSTSLVASSQSPSTIPTVTPIVPTLIPTPTIYLLPTELPVPTTPMITITPTLTRPNTLILKATYGPPLGLDPTEFNVKANVPVRLEVYATVDGRGCMGSITIPNFTNDIQVFTKGQTNVFEFTPQTPGTYEITCAMGIPHGFITVE